MIVATLLQPFQLDFMLSAFAIAVLVAIPAAMLSCYLVLKGWALMGDAIAHAILPGVVLAYIAGVPLLVGAFSAGMMCSMVTGYVSENSRLRRDTVMGIVFSSMFGFGIVLYTAIQSDMHLDHILFGDMLGIKLVDLLQASIIMLAATSFLVVFRQDLLVFVFDPVQAHALGLWVRFLHYALLAVITMVVVGALKAVGIIIAIGMLILPGATAFLLTRRFKNMLLIAISIAVFCSITGVYLSFFLDSAPAPTIILIMGAVFVCAAINGCHTNYILGDKG